MTDHRRIPAARFRPVLNELEAVASCELADVLALIRWGDPLTLDEQDQLDTYLAEELQHGGLLSAEHIRAAGNSAVSARRIEHSAAMLRHWLAS